MLNNLKKPIEEKQTYCIEIDLGGTPAFSCYLSDSEIDYPTGGDPLSLVEITRLISQAEDLGVKSIVLMNNEKDQHPDTMDILKFIREKRIQADAFISSGTFNLVEPAPVHCVKHKFSCYVKNDGMVYPCIGLPLAIGDIRKNSLKKILSDSEIIQNLKNHTFRIKGPCRNCEEFSQCCGCRARAFLLTKDYLASDPLCPENQDKLDKITHLPMSAENLIPQTKGMRVVSTLLETGERYAIVESCFSKQSPFVKKDGSLEDIAYMEIMAQSAAVMNGFEKFDTGATDSGGFLIGGQKINMYMKTYAGQKLQTDIFKVTKFGSFGILSATIKRGEDLIAEGEIKIFENDGADNAV